MKFFHFKKPKWYKNLPTYFQPDESKIEDLEYFRTNRGIEDDFFSMLISTTPWSVRKLQWFMLDKFKSERPDLAEKELWQFVIVSRMNVKLMTVDYPKDYGSSPLSKDEINCIVNNAKSIAEKYHNFDQVVDYLVELDYKENRFNDPSGILDRLNKLLES